MKVNEYVQKLIKSLFVRDTEKAKQEKTDIDKQNEKVKKIKRAKKNNLRT